MNAAAELTGLGIPITARLDVVEQLRKHADAVAKLYAHLFLGDLAPSTRSPARRPVAAGL
ncbi:hypothetical protein HBB16_17370 [Pseudonocardia sp. MCCB 268]|nr:hypothetical protein [Pseudonocardia cytotoxica]